MKPITRSDILALSISERILLVEEIWDTIAESPGVLPLPDAQKAELDNRLDAYQRDPAAGAPWEEVLARAGDR